jgi:hypothetical protein
MSPIGQERKYSNRANDVCFTPIIGHAAAGAVGAWRQVCAKTPSRLSFRLHVQTPDDNGGPATGLKPPASVLETDSDEQQGYELAILPTRSFTGFLTSVLLTTSTEVQRKRAIGERFRRERAVDQY